MIEYNAPSEHIRYVYIYNGEFNLWILGSRELSTQYLQALTKSRIDWTSNAFSWCRFWGHMIPLLFSCHILSYRLRQVLQCWTVLPFPHWKLFIELNPMILYYEQTYICMYIIIIINKCEISRHCFKKLYHRIVWFFIKMHCFSNGSLRFFFYNWIFSTCSK